MDFHSSQWFDEGLSYYDSHSFEYFDRSQFNSDSHFNNHEWWNVDPLQDFPNFSWKNHKELDPTWQIPPPSPLEQLQEKREFITLKNGKQISRKLWEEVIAEPFIIHNTEIEPSIQDKSSLIHSPKVESFSQQAEQSIPTFPFEIEASRAKPPHRKPFLDNPKSHELPISVLGKLAECKEIRQLSFENNSIVLYIEADFEEYAFKDPFEEYLVEPRNKRLEEETREECKNSMEIGRRYEFLAFTILFILCHFRIRGRVFSNLRSIEMNDHHWKPFFKDGYIKQRFTIALSFST